MGGRREGIRRNVRLIVAGGRRALAIRYWDGGRSRQALVSSDEPELLLEALRPTERSEASVQVRVGAVAPLESQGDREFMLDAVEEVDDAAPEIQTSKARLR